MPVPDMCFFFASIGVPKQPNQREPAHMSQKCLSQQLQSPLKTPQNCDATAI